MANLHTYNSTCITVIILYSGYCNSDYILKMIEISKTGVEFLLHKRVYKGILNKFNKQLNNSEASYMT